jgi:glucose-6-phosphate dehydrogenase assembly protein OpcA
MTHIAWAPPEWQTAAEETLSGMAERHPSRTLLLVPKPDEPDGLDAQVSIRCFPVGDRAVCGEVIELDLRGNRASAPGSIALPLLISDLPVFCRWRGQPDWDSPAFEQLIGIVDRLVVDSTEWPDLPVFCRWRGQPDWDSPAFEQLIGIVDRLVVDSTEWPDLPEAYARLVELFPRVVVSDIAWERTERWRSLLASLWPDIRDVRTIRVHGTRAQAHLLAGWLRSRLGHDVALEIDERERIEGIDLDGNPAPFPPGKPPGSSDVLSAQLDRFSREPIYEQAVSAAATS